LLEVTGRQVAEVRAAAEPFAENVDGDGPAERGWAENEIAARRELAVRGATRSLLSPRLDASLVELVDHHLAHGAHDLERRLAVDGVDPPSQSVDPVLRRERRRGRAIRRGVLERPGHDFLLQELAFHHTALRSGPTKSHVAQPAAESGNDGH